MACWLKQQLEKSLGTWFDPSCAGKMFLVTLGKSLNLTSTFLNQNNPPGCYEEP